MDDEPLQLSASALEHHLAGCRACTAWLQSAERAGRSIRVSGDVPPDLSGGILADVVLPARRIRRYRLRLRIGLAALGVVQWALAMPALFGETVGMAMPMHASHESAAWNVALGAAFLAVAIKPARAPGTLPILATFVAVLAVLSLPDLADGAVDGARLASHLGVVTGLLLTALCARSERLLPPPGSVRGADATAGRDLGAGRPAGLRPHRRRGAA